MQGQWSVSSSQHDLAKSWKDMVGERMCLETHRGDVRIRT
jgi:hypothetical protein